MTGMQNKWLASVGRMGRKHGVVGVAVLDVPSETTCLVCDGGCTGARNTRAFVRSKCKVM